jgi:putative aldouronate transport system permease protein
MLSPAVIVVFMMQYVPIAGIVLAFKNYNITDGIYGSPWVKPIFANFGFFFRTGGGIIATRNTVLYNLLNLFTSMTFAIIIAIILSEMRAKKYKRISQSIIFLPYFISWVIVGAFVYNIFDVKTGALNSLLRFLGFAPVNLYSMPWTWIIVICAFNSWKWVGYNSVIYIAAIAGVDVECFEAADLDGASIFQKIWYVTLPGIMNTIVILFLLNIGRIMRGDFQMFYNIIGNNGQLFDATDVIDTYVFRSLVTNPDFGMNAAATLYQSVACFVIISLVNQLIKRYDKDYALF